jgi:uncharacterized membrane protein (DUF106 family)
MKRLKKMLSRVLRVLGKMLAVVLRPVVKALGWVAARLSVVVVVTLVIQLVTGG